MLCWICGGAPAETGEHMIKVSDLKHLFGHTTTEKPLYRRINSGSQELVQGARSPKLKFQTRLCAYCNNTRTQPHDKSWDALATFLRDRPTPLAPGDIVHPAAAFDVDLQSGLLGVHLYFVKLSGCLFSDGGVPIGTASFAQAILSTAAHPNIYLAFMAVTSKKLANYAWVTPVETISMLGNVVGAQWFYFVGRIGVHVTYATQIDHSRSNDKVHLWHPTFAAESLTIDGR